VAEAVRSAGGDVILADMKSTPSGTHWMRGAIATVLVLVGLAIVWIVFLGPAALILLRPR